MPNSLPPLKPDWVRHPEEVLVKTKAPFTRFMIATVFTLLGFLLLTLMFFGVYIGSCFLDRKPPIHGMKYRAEDTVAGGLVQVDMTFERDRICAYSFIRMVVDSKGKIVYKAEDSRMVNGPVRKIDITDYYQIDVDASPGTATMYLYASWKCPYNIVHNWLPITRDYSDTFEILPNINLPKIKPEDLNDSEVKTPQIKE